MKIKAIGQLVKANPIQSQFKPNQTQFAGGSGMMYFDDIRLYAP
jgi:hypothetical protein